MRSSYASMMMVVGFGLGCVALGSGCVAQADSGDVEESAEAPVGEVSEALIYCASATSCAPALSGGPGVEVTMTSAGLAQALSPDASYANASPYVYTLQADVPTARMCMLPGLMGRGCRLWQYTAAIPSGVFSFKASAAPSQADFNACLPTYVAVRAEGWDPVAAQWIPMPIFNQYTTNLAWGCGPAQAIVTNLDLTQYNIHGVTAVRVHASAQIFKNNVWQPERVVANTWTSPY